MISKEDFKRNCKIVHAMHGTSMQCTGHHLVINKTKVLSQCMV